MATPELDTNNSRSPEILIWDNQPLSVAFVDADFEPTRDVQEPIASEQFDNSGVYMQCFFSDEDDAISSHGEVGVNPILADKSIKKTKRVIGKVFWQA